MGRCSDWILIREMPANLMNSEVHLKVKIDDISVLTCSSVLSLVNLTEENLGIYVKIKICVPFWEF